MNKFVGILRNACNSCCRSTHTHTPQPLLSRPPIFRASHGMSCSAIQLRISVLQLNSAIPEQNERPKPSGEKSADNPHLQSPAGNTLSLWPFTQRQRSCVCVSVCLCVGLRGAEREFVCIPFISLLTDASSALSPSDLRHTITPELQYDCTVFFISLRICVKEFLVFAVEKMLL